MANDPRLYEKSDPSKTAPVDADKETEGKPKPNALLARYWREIEAYRRAVSSWYEEGDQITEVYLDGTRKEGSNTRKFPLLWANVETLKPAVYTKLPNIMCDRRYKDRDPIARTASEIMERAANTTFDNGGVDEVLRMVRDDRLLPGRGQGWVRYEAELESYEEEAEEVDAETNEIITKIIKRERLISEKMCVDYVHWKEFGHNCARTWSDVWIVWRDVFKTQEEITERFGAEIAAKLSYNAKSPSFGAGSSADASDKCKVTEVWDKNRKLVSWMAEGHDQFLESGPPPIDFELGFPCPEPCYATKSSKELIPKPDYAYYRDQAHEINSLTSKIQNMTQWLIVKGFIPSAPSNVADAIEEVLKDKGNSELFVKIESMQEFTDLGGSGKLIDWLPLDKVIMALKAAIDARNQLIQDVFQLTGISDVLRGQTDPNETLGAQELKAQTGSKRMKNTKDDIARFSKDIARLVCEGIAEQFSPQTIADMTGFKYIPAPVPGQMEIFAPGQAMPPMQPGGPMGSQPTGPDQMQSDPDADMTFDDKVMELLRNDRMRGFRIDIETDSTIQPDENAEKQRRMEFLGAVGPYMTQAVEAISKAPGLAPAMGEILMHVVRGFRTGRGMEETIEKSFQTIAKQVMQQQAMAAQQPNPDVLKVQQTGEVAKATLMLKAEGQQADHALAANKQQTDAMLKVREQNLDAEAKARDTQASAIAQARDRAARMLAGAKPQGNA
jgi:hypothetical protein